MGPFMTQPTAQGYSLPSWPRPVFPLYISYPSARHAAKGMQAFVYDHQGACQYRLYGGRERGATEFWRVRFQREPRGSAVCPLFSALGSECGSSFRNRTVVYDAEDREIGILKQSIFGSCLSLYRDGAKLLRIRISVIPVHITCCRNKEKSGLELKRASRDEVPEAGRTGFSMKAHGRGGDADILQLFCSMIVPLIVTEGLNLGPVVE